jgi:hypothetical protein
MLIYLNNKIVSMFLTTKKYRKNLYSKYYKEAKYNILNDSIKINHKKQLLYNLKNDTIYLINENNISYTNNMNIYQHIINILLFDIPKLVEKYHLGIICNENSIIYNFTDIIRELLYFDEIIAIQYYNWLLDTFNFHNVYICCEKNNKIFDDLIVKISDLKNEHEVKKYLDRLSSIITNIEMQEYYALKIDLHKESSKDRQKNISYYDSGYFEKIYDKVYANKYLDDKEKFNCYINLFEIFRVSITKGCTDVRHIINDSFGCKSPEESDIPPCIYGQATALLLLKILKNKDEIAFKLLMMNLIGDGARFAIHCILLFLNEEENAMYEYIFEYDKIDLEYCKTVIQRIWDE